MNPTQLICFKIAFTSVDRKAYWFANIINVSRTVCSVNDVLDNAHIIINGMPLYKFHDFFFLNISPRKILSIQTAYDASPNGRNTMIINCVLY